LPLLFHLLAPPPRPTLFPYTRSSDLCTSSLCSGASRGRESADKCLRSIATPQGGGAGCSRWRYLSLLSSRRRPRLICSIPSSNSDRKSTRLNSSHQIISYAVFCLKKK